MYAAVVFAYTRAGVTRLLEQSNSDQKYPSNLAIALVKTAVNSMPPIIQRLARRISALVLGILLICAGGLMGMAKPPPAMLTTGDMRYVQAVLRLPGDALQGQAIFQMNCAVCHGNKANGNVGPSLQHVSSRKSRQALIEQVISGNTPPMPQFQPSAQTMADLLSYLDSL
jgi:mono/diheme cytochrome c family protein